MNHKKETEPLRWKKVFETPCIARVKKLPEGFEDEFPFKEGDSVLFLGEINNMPGHVAVVNKEGKVIWGFHDDNFEILDTEEV